MFLRIHFFPNNKNILSQNVNTYAPVSMCYSHLAWKMKQGVCVCVCVCVYVIDDPSTLKN
jgi:hypothetical protein